ncbi:DUF6114 domain-containing protein [Streptomyces sp. NBC_00272]|uniref:DUF6114 domain-containing protein n=1 Tax=Streptomyces sp. NBC_00272 TaxID=2975698 RepID=UPI002E2A90AE|nr:DUF6114 domain-containing protein [Streptomyces sp. NBC_00272]
MTTSTEWRDALSRARKEFRTWRDSRPFWAGLMTLSAGWPILYLAYGHLTLGGVTLALSTAAGAGSLVIGVLLVTLGLLMWLRPPVRVFAGVAAILLSLISLPLANFGGLLLGAVLGLVGGSLACAWSPPSEDPDDDGQSAFPSARESGGPHAP